MSKRHFLLLFIPFIAAGCSGDAIEGKYTSPEIASVEFLKDGTAVFLIRGKQVIWKWSKYEDGRLKLEPGAGISGADPAVCNYTADAKTLTMTDCEYAMKLTRI